MLILNSLLVVLLILYCLNCYERFTSVEYDSTFGFIMNLIGIIILLVLFYKINIGGSIHVC